MYSKFENYKKKIKKQDLHLVNLIDYIHLKTKNKKFRYKLNNGDQLDITLEKQQIPHLLGVNKLNFNRLGKLKGQYALDKIYDNTIKGADVHQHANFKHIRDRILHSHSIPYILENADAFHFDAFKIRKGDRICSTMTDVKFLLKNKDLHLTVYLGLKKNQHEENLINAFPATYLVDRDDSFQQGTTAVKVESIDIIDM